MDLENSQDPPLKTSTDRKNNRMLMKYTVLLPSISLLLIALDYFMYLYQISTSGTSNVETLQLPSGAYPFKQEEASIFLTLLVTLILIVNFFTAKTSSTLANAMKAFAKLFIASLSIAAILSSYQDLSSLKTLIILYIFISSMVGNVVLLKIVWLASNNDNTNSATPLQRYKAKKMISKVHIMRKPDGTLVKKKRMIDSRNQSQKFRRMRKRPPTQ